MIFDRIPSPPSQSARFPLSAAGVPRNVEVREVHWQLTPDFPLNQGEQGACIGFGCSAELSAEPIAYPTGTPFAFQLYELARAEDEAMGNRFPAGATMLAGLRAMRKLGLIEGFAWARTATDVRDAVVAHGAVVMGTEWLADMDRWDHAGLIRATGEVRGGHCWTIVGYIPRHPVYGAVFECVNSWGTGWGVSGRFLLLESDLAVLMGRDGEAAIVTDTPLVPTPDPVCAARLGVAYHRPGAHWWPCPRPFADAAAAQVAGLRACRICKP